jgi:hypothetical protein
MESFVTAGTKIVRGQVRFKLRAGFRVPGNYPPQKVCMLKTMWITRYTIPRNRQMRSTFMKRPLEPYPFISSS